MVYSKPDIGPVFGALADPTRRFVLETLRSGERAISELAGPFDMTLPGFSKHIRVLRRAGLVDVRRSGRVRICRLEPAPLRAGRSWIDGFAGFWRAELAQVERYLAADEDSRPPRAER